MQNPYRRLPISFSYVLTAALLFSALILLEDYADYLINQFEFEYSWFSVSVKALSTYLVWVMLSPLISAQAFLIQAKVGSKRSVQIGISVLVSILVALIHRFLYQRGFDFAYYLNTGFMAAPFSEKNMLLLGTGWITSIIQYWIILLIFFAVIYYQEYLTKQEELNKAQLQALKMQLHPHFLFNTLHSISSLIDIDRKAAQKMVAQLGGLMRNTLEQEEKSAATLLEEIEYVKSYLDIEYVRFQDRLQINYDIHPDVESAIVPYLILQPLIENAVKHGIQDMKENGQIFMSAKGILSDRVKIEIRDNGIQTNFKREGTGLGMKNVRNRLAQFYGGDYLFDFGPLEPQGFGVKIEIPYIENLTS